jgi:hypothetical protein
MMLEKMIQDFARHLEAKLDEWANQLRQEWNVAQLGLDHKSGHRQRIKGFIAFKNI